jgi:glutamate racemase
MIGIFDSGFGGLTVLKELLNQLPEYNYIYLGDNARAPYGSKSPAVIYRYTKEAVDFLFQQGCQLIIVACHTASAKALRRIQQEWLLKVDNQRRVLGVVIPVAEAAADCYQEAKERGRLPWRLGIIGTRVAIESRVYEKELAKILTFNKSGLKAEEQSQAEKKAVSLPADIEIYTQACPLLVPLIEEGWIKKPETKMILKKYLRSLKIKQVRALILGCTHYPLLLPQIAQIMGRQVRIINTPPIVAEKLKDYLTRHPEIEKKLSRGREVVFYTTDDASRFKNLGSRFLGQPIAEVKSAVLEN